MRVHHTSFDPVENLRLVVLAVDPEANVGHSLTADTAIIRVTYPEPQDQPRGGNQ